MEEDGLPERSIAKPVIHEGFEADDEPLVFGHECPFKRDWMKFVLKPRNGERTTIRIGLHDLGLEALWRRLSLEMSDECSS